MEVHSLYPFFQHCEMENPGRVTLVRASCTGPAAWCVPNLFRPRRARGSDVPVPAPSHPFSCLTTGIGIMTYAPRRLRVSM